MYQGHKGAFAVRAQVDAEMNRRVPNCMASASMKAGRVLVTAVNSSHDQPIDAVISLRGYQPASATARILSGKLQAHNTFAAPDQVKPVATQAAVSGREIRISLPASSVASVEIVLG
jgi:alpha-N-arabinofuranosidase